MNLFQIIFNLIFIIYLVDGNHRGKCESTELIWIVHFSAFGCNKIVHFKKRPVSRHHKTLFPQVFTLCKDTEKRGNISRNINDPEKMSKFLNMPWIKFNDLSRNKTLILNFVFVSHRLWVIVMSQNGEFMIHDRYCKKTGCTIMEHESVLLFDPFRLGKLNQLLERKRFDQNSMKPNQIRFWNIEPIETKELKIHRQKPREYRYGHPNLLSWKCLFSGRDS